MREFRGMWKIAGMDPLQLELMSVKVLKAAYYTIIPQEELDGFFDRYLRLVEHRKAEERASRIPLSGKVLTWKSNSKRKKWQNNRNQIWNNRGAAGSPQESTEEKRVIRESILTGWICAQVRGIRDTLKVMVENFEHASQMLDTTDFDSDKLLIAIAYHNRELLMLSNYYTQLSNQNFLPGKKDAWTRTCNLTSLSMCLNGLGATNINFNGDWDLLGKIYLIIQKEINEQNILMEDFDDKLNEAKTSLSNIELMRMPDFMQLVAVYYQMQIFENNISTNNISSAQKTIYKRKRTKFKELSTFVEKVDFSRKVIAPLISTQAHIFSDMPKYFACVRLALNLPNKLWDRCYSLGKHDNYWETRTRLTKAKIKKIRRRINGLKKRVSTQESVQEKIDELENEVAGLKQSISTDVKEDYKANHVQWHKKEIKTIIEPFINSGFQVIVNLKGHYVRLENIEEKGIRYDDPWAGGFKSKGKSTFLNWEKSSENSFFKAFHLICRKEEIGILVKLWDRMKSIDDVEFIPEEIHWDA